MRAGSTPATSTNKENIMFCVYHVEGSEEGLIPVATFYTNVTDALKWSNSLRDQGFKFVSIASEVEGNSTKMGATGPDENYVPQLNYLPIAQ